MFKINLINISSRLIFVGITLTILFISIIFIGFISTNSIYQQIFDLFDDRYKKIELINSIKEHSNKVAENFLEILINNNTSLKVKSIFKDIHNVNDINNERNKILNEMEELQKITRTERGLELLKIVTDSYNKYLELQDYLIKAINNGTLINETQQLFNDIQEHHLQC